MTEHVYYVEGIEAEMIEVSSFADTPDGRYVPGDVRVMLRNAAGSFGVPWWPLDALPSIGARVHITVEVETP